MNELVIIQDFGGKKAVSVKELYEALGLQKAHWAKWYRKNITENPFAAKDEDWVHLTLRVSMPGSQDFALTIDFAKKLSMMARTPQGEKVRDYFIEVEKSFLTKHSAILSPAEALLQNVQILVTHERKISELDNKVNGVLKVQEENQEEHMELPLSDDPVKEVSLRSQVNRLVKTYASQVGLVHSVVWGRIYQELEERYGFRLSCHRRCVHESLLADAERKGLLGKLHAITSEMVRSLPENTETSRHARLC
jgi:anti-repressor protein